MERRQIPNIETFASCDETRRNATLREVEQKTGISYQQVCEMIQWDLRAKLEQAAPLIDVSDELFQFLRAAFPGRH